MVQRKHKVILIGSNGYQRTRDDLIVDCCDWDSISTIKNIRDYDTIILDLIPLESEELRDKVSWTVFFEQLDYAGSMDILINGGKIIILGDPRFNVRHVPKITKTSGPEIELPFLHWTGLLFKWDSAPGDTVVNSNYYEHKKFSRYLTRLNRWAYSLQSVEIETGKLAKRFDMNDLKKNNSIIRLNRELLSVNRCGNALAFMVALTKGSIAKSSIKTITGPVIFLPKNSLSHDEAVQCILTDVCGIETDLPEPDWVERYRAPDQEALDIEIKRIEEQLDSAEKNLEEARTQKKECRKCLRLLYEREYALEPVVCDILRELGAEVESSTENNKEDGWVTVTTGGKVYEGVLEIKSTRSDTFDEGGRKQLLDWIDRGRTIREKNYKGIFIGNSAVDKPPNERVNAFSKSWQKAAELSQICVLKTENLYLFHLLNAGGKLNKDKLWNDIFETNGLFNMKDYINASDPNDVTVVHGS